MAVKEIATFSSCKHTQFQCINDTQTTPDQTMLTNTDTFASCSDVQTVFQENVKFLSAIPGVIGVDINHKPQPSILVFVNKKEYDAVLPNQLNSFPVEIVEFEGKAYFA